MSSIEPLSDESLVSRCLHGGTQNQNEPINAMIWQRATKETHLSHWSLQLFWLCVTSIMVQKLLYVCQKNLE